MFDCMNVCMNGKTGHSNHDKLNELLQWLAKNSMPVEVNVRPLHDNETLLNE